MLTIYERKIATGNSFAACLAGYIAASQHNAIDAAATMTKLSGCASTGKVGIP
jgi:hydroxyethylthiazole kinase-like sugar kinase family protein